MGTGFAGRHSASHQLTEAFDRLGPDFATQGPSERLAAHRLVKASGRVPAQPRTPSWAGPGGERPVRLRRQPDQIDRRRRPSTPDARSAGGYGVLSGSPDTASPGVASPDTASIVSSGFSSSTSTAAAGPG
jgi:hypothetical protein